MLCLDFQVLLSMTPKKVRRIKDANMVQHPMAGEGILAHGHPRSSE